MFRCMPRDVGSWQGGATLVRQHGPSCCPFLSLLLRPHPAAVHCSSLLPTFFTTSSTSGCSSSVRYAPTPKFSLLGSVDFLNASLTPRIGSGGAISTLWSLLARALTTRMCGRPRHELRSAAWTARGWTCMKQTVVVVCDARRLAQLPH
jgi:hypothetical protein